MVPALALGGRRPAALLGGGHPRPADRARPALGARAALDRAAERTDAARLEERAGLGEGEVLGLDLLPAVCPAEECPPLIGNVHVMFDQDHATATCRESAGGEADRQLAEAGSPW